MAKGFAKELKAGECPYKPTNLWCDILAEQAKRGILTELGEQEAQEKANGGYVVIGAWKNTNGSDGPPHFVTVRPGFKVDPENGPMLANVGATNGIKPVSDGFGLNKRENICWYYNPNQDYHYEPKIIQQYVNYE
jgi:hypothetical protein